MKIVQIKGANGTGKTTLVKSLIATSMHLTLYEWADTHKIFATGMDDIGWIAIGEYKIDKKMGGCDNIKSIDDTKQAIRYCIEELNYHSLIFEGMMISTITSTFYDWLIDIDGIEPIFVMLVSSLDGCLDRIAKRGTKSVMKSSEGVKGKIHCIERQITQYDPRYVRIINVDETPKNKMLETFLKQV